MKILNSLKIMLFLLPISTNAFSSIDNVAFMESEGRNNFLVFCKYGTIERVNLDEISSDDLCPTLHGDSEETNMRWIYHREDGLFDVTCRDHRRLIVTKSQVKSETACKAAIKHPVLKSLKDGKYKGNYDDCDSIYLRVETHDKVSGYVYLTNYCYSHTYGATHQFYCAEGSDSCVGENRYWKFNLKMSRGNGFNITNFSKRTGEVSYSDLWWKRGFYDFEIVEPNLIHN